MGAATATADAPTGILSARTQGQSASGIGGLLDADASAEIEEAVFLVPEQGSPVTPVPFGIFMDLDGSLELGGVGVPSSSNLQTASARASGVLGISGLTVTGVSPASFAVVGLVQAAAGEVLLDETSIQLQ